MPAPVNHLNAMAAMKATGNCTRETSPQLQIDDTTTSIVNKLFIYLKA
jgi:hypothetical protein